MLSLFTFGQQQTLSFAFNERSSELLRHLGFMALYSIQWPSMASNGPSYLQRLQWYSMALIGIPWPFMALNTIL